MTLTTQVDSLNDHLGATVSGVNDTDAASGRDWTFLSNHGHVLLAISHDPEVRLRDIAVRVGITERAVQLIVADLVEGEYIAREKVGRRNRYTILSGRQFRHPAERTAPLDEFLDIFKSDRVAN
jgi:DNA-binding MarR family transcriptional regulator